MVNTGKGGKFLTITGLLLVLTAFSQIGTAAADPSWEERVALSFAPQEQQERNEENRFGQFDLENGELHGSYEDAHELNDAWLGMPVRDTSGKVVGYVDDAFLDEEGYLTELVVTLNNSTVTVYVNQKHVEYTEVGVLVDMPVQAIAGLERFGG